jgi:hypothetical protein
MLYRCTVKKNKHAMLLYSKYFYATRDIDKMVKLGLFDKAIACDVDCGRKKAKVSVEAVKNAVVEHFDDVFATHDIAISNFDEIISTNDVQWLDFNIYCTLKNIRYSFLEISTNSSARMREHLKKNDPFGHRR